MKEEYKMTLNMKKFFENLFEIKEFVRNKYEASNDQVLKEIYKKLDFVIKEKETK